MSGHDQLLQIFNTSKPTLSVLASCQLDIVPLESGNNFITPSKRKLFVLFWQGWNEPNKPLPHFRVERKIALYHCGLTAFSESEIPIHSSLVPHGELTLISLEKISRNRTKSASKYIIGKLNQLHNYKADLPSKSLIFAKDNNI